MNKWTIIKLLIFFTVIILLVTFSVDIEEWVYYERMRLIELEETGQSTTSQEVWLEILVRYVGILAATVFAFLWSLVFLLIQGASSILRLIALSFLGAEIVNSR